MCPGASPQAACELTARRLTSPREVIQEAEVSAATAVMVWPWGSHAVICAVLTQTGCDSVWEETQGAWIPEGRTLGAIVEAGYHT